MTKSFQYTAHCRHCFTTRAMTRSQIETGKNPLCDGCGDTMVVCSGTGALPEALNRPTDQPPGKLDELRRAGVI